MHIFVIFNLKRKFKKPNIFSKTGCWTYPPSKHLFYNITNEPLRKRINFGKSTANTDNINSRYSCDSNVELFDSPRCMATLELLDAGPVWSDQNHISTSCRNQCPFNFIVQIVHLLETGREVKETGITGSPENTCLNMLT